PPAEPGGRPADAGAPLGAQRDLSAALGLLLEHGRHVAGPVGADQVDQPLGLVHLDPVGGQVGQGDGGPDERGLGNLGDAAEGVGDQTQVADVVGLEHGLGDLVLADPGGQQLGRQPVGVGGGGLVLEAPGVGDQPGVEGGGDLGVQRQVEAPEQLPAEHGAGRGDRVDQVDVAEAGVGGVVVDDHGAGGG